jgi:hypothetical protein
MSQKEHNFDESIPQPFPSWILKENNLGKYWDAPVKMPTDGKIYIWDEENILWKEYINENIS